MFVEKFFLRIKARPELQEIGFEMTPKLRKSLIQKITKILHANTIEDMAIDEEFFENF